MGRFQSMSLGESTKRISETFTMWLADRVRIRMSDLLRLHSKKYLIQSENANTNSKENHTANKPQDRI